jgi:class 3 adenylate cyclase
MKIDVDALSLAEIVQLQNELSDALRRRFTRPMALCFTDIVGSTAYLARFGDEAGRRLYLRHLEILSQAIEPCGGRIVDTAGDGAFCCFPTVPAATGALCDFFLRLAEDNDRRTPSERLSVRSGMHWGEVLTDGAHVSGEAVNLCSRVAQSSGPDEIQITRDAFQELKGSDRLRCKTKGPVALKGIADPVELFRLVWQDETELAVAVFVDEMNREILLPEKDTISFGRMPNEEGNPGNDVILSSADPESARSISRYHFELRRGARGFTLHALSRSLTLVDGRSLPEGGTARIVAGSVVNVGGVFTLRFRGAAPATGGPATALTSPHLPSDG